MALEKWLPVFGWEGVYEVSNLGRVRSIERTQRDSLGKVRKFPNRVLKLKLQKTGYLRVSLSAPGRRSDELVHRLVCQSFHGDAPEGKNLVLHGNGEKTDNSASNLRWGDFADNAADSIKHGTNKQKSKTHCSQGHEYSPSNTRISPEGHRVCKKCHRDRERMRSRVKRRDHALSI